MPETMLQELEQAQYQADMAEVWEDEDPLLAHVDSCDAPTGSCAICTHFFHGPDY